MNLFALLNRGAQHAQDAQQAAIAKGAEAARAQWLNALLVDQTRAWMAVGADDAETVNGLTVLLTLAAFAGIHDARTNDTPDIRIIRGAVEAAKQCVLRGGAITVADARAFGAAATRAHKLITNASHAAIIHASVQARDLVDLPN